MFRAKPLQILAVCAAFVLLACKVVANDTNAHSDSARRFVQNFYIWYVPAVQVTQFAPPWKIALVEREDTFDHELALVLKDDIRGQEDVTGEIVGVDFDPFLYSQDPCERYEVGSVSARQGKYFIDVHGVCSGVRNGLPDVVAEVAEQGGRWRIVNLHYAKDKNLVSILRLLHDARSK
jgi:Protein of unknown function (DUF3828)